MKTKLLYMLLFISSYAFAQNWSQVGATQFTNFASDGAISFHPSSGEPYVVHDNLVDGSKPYVMKFNGTNWVAVGGVISSEFSINHAIKFNPVTNEPWIAYRRTSDNKLDVYRYDGTSWIAEGIAIGTGNLSDHRVQIQFNASGNARVGARVTNKRLRIFTYSSTNTWTTSDQVLQPTGGNSDQRYDFTSYNSFYRSLENTYAGQYSGNAAKKNVGAGGNVNIWNTPWSSAYRFKNISGIADENYLAVNNIQSGNNHIYIFENLTEIKYVSNITNDIVHFRKDVNNNELYLMYANASENLTFEKYNTIDSVWETLPLVGLNLNSVSFDPKMSMNAVDGNMYVLYLDGTRLSVKMYSIPVPTNLPKYYVDANATGNNDGSSWADAHTNMQDALFNAGNATTEIWVASGIYKPGSSRNKTFEFEIDNLQIYGGFDGTETYLSERNVLANPTILSGDLNADDTGVDLATASRSDNAYHVTRITANNVVLDGFKIEDGHANGSSSNTYGGGLYISDTANDVVIKNCEFNNNTGLTGGAVRVYYDTNTSATIENCIFNNNVSRYGGGLYFLVNNNRTVTLEMTNCLFINNTSKDQNTTNKGYTGSSAWLRANGTASSLTATITNCTFANNMDLGTQSGSLRGALAISRRVDGNATLNATINNSVFYNNEGVSSNTTASINQGHASLPNLTLVNNSIGEDNFSNLIYLTNTSNANPMFTDASNNDFTLMSGSPAIDTGDNSKILSGIITDLLGNQRIYNTTVDMGVYEFGAPSLGVENYQDKLNFILFPNPTRNTLHIQIDIALEKAEIYNLLGQKVLESTTKTIDVSNLKSGVYMIKIANKKGGFIAKHFVKQ